MRTIRRLYFYLVAFISLETVIWGGIYLARTVFNIGILTQISDLAGGFSLVLVGLPIFLLHWLVAQHDAGKDEEERSARIRALFLYAVRLATLVPIVLNIIAILNRLVLQAVGLNPLEAALGGNETLADNLIVVLVNLVTLIYFEYVLRSEWKIGASNPAYAETRRLFRYLWMLFTFALTITGTTQLLYAIFSSLGAKIIFNQIILANGISFTLLSAPLWAMIWVYIQKQLADKDESQSWMRLVVLHILALIGAVTTITTVFILLKDLGILITAAESTLIIFISEHSLPLALMIVMAVIWAYFDLHLRVQIEQEENLINRAAMLRFYNYILAVLGFGFLFSGMLWLGRVLIELAMNAIGIPALREAICGAASALLVGLVVWMKRWFDAQQEARREDEIGEHARRSVVRKSALYLAVFSGVVGVMASAGALLFLVINTVLGGQEPNFLLEFLYRFEALLVVSVWLAYYLFILIQDGRYAHQSLNQRHAAFGVLLLDMEDGFVLEFNQTLQRIAPGLPVQHLKTSEWLQSDSEQKNSAVVLPLSLITQPSEALNRRLSTFDGQRLVVPLPQTGWTWLSSLRRSQRDLARDAAQAVRQLSEGQEVRPNANSGWMLVLSILGGLFVFQLVLVLFSLGISLFFSF